ncbi:MAG: cyclic nucleotide-binding domain-containing protein [bacterium]|nr:cyclic nucleotide-binding domain-containing protein [bacterium]
MVTRDLISNLTFFKDFPQEVLEKIAANGMEAELEQNEIVVQHHDEANWVLFLLSGTAQVYLNFPGQEPLFVGKISDPGSLIGWSAFRAPYRYTSTIRCEEPCRILKIPRNTFEEIQQEDLSLGFEILQRVAEVLALRLDQTKELLIQTGPQGQVQTET